CLFEGGIERAAVQPEEDVALLHVIAFFEAHGNELTGNLRANFHRGCRLDRTDDAHINRHGLFHHFADSQRHAVTTSAPSAHRRRLCGNGRVIFRGAARGCDNRYDDDTHEASTHALDPWVKITSNNRFCFRPEGTEFRICATTLL